MLLFMWIICSLILTKIPQISLIWINKVHHTRWRNKQTHTKLKYEDKNNLLLTCIAYLRPLMNHNLLISLFSHWHTWWHSPLSYINFRLILYDWNKHSYVQRKSIYINKSTSTDEHVWLYQWCYYCWFNTDMEYINVLTYSNKKFNVRRSFFILFRHLMYICSNVQNIYLL